jgi:hypothetical protein
VAREEHSREDLLRDARALVPRVRLRLLEPPLAEPIFAGFRGAALSLYFGEDPVFHFNGEGRLRRAHVDGRLLKAQAQRLTSMRRERAADETSLISHELDDDEQRQLLESLAKRLDDLRLALCSGAIEIDGQVPADGDGIARLLRWLEANEVIEVAESPHVE